MSPAVGEKGVSDDVSPHDRIGLPVGAEADECYGDQPQFREDAVLAADEQVGVPGRAAFGRDRATGIGGRDETDRADSGSRMV